MSVIEERTLRFTNCTGEPGRSALTSTRASLQLYVMTEIPSNAIVAEDFAERFDGLSTVTISPSSIPTSTSCPSHFTASWQSNKTSPPPSGIKFRHNLHSTPVSPLFTPSMTAGTVDRSRQRRPC